MSKILNIQNSRKIQGLKNVSYTLLTYNDQTAYTLLEFTNNLLNIINIAYNNTRSID